ncbi:MAG TPA: LTA synthase family protein [Burkholderiaceae bacterium]|nr:LTA synthase family protein [Burkholderiaceae bacterium]
MVIRGTTQAGTEASADPGRMIRILEVARRFLAALPPFALGLVLLRLAELVEGWPPGASAAAASSTVAAAFAQDLLTLGRYLPALFLLSSPLLALPTARARLWGIGALWSALLLAQLALVTYFLNTRVPLGADLFSYSWSEIRTSAAGSRPDLAVVIAGVMAIAVLWLMLWRQSRRVDHAPSSRASVLLFATCLGLLVAAPQELPPPGRSETEYAHSLRLSKLATFIGSNLEAMAEHRLRGVPLQAAVVDAHAQAVVSENPISGFRYLDPRYPFLHADETPDVLGPLVSDDQRTPPNLVFVIVEGLGRSFSGPGADLGSFTPFLDDLAGRSLYFENFLSDQGRTFAVLPSVFGSLPFGDEGFLALGARMPEHASLLSILHGQGYRTRFFSGTDPAFDNEEAFLQRQGLDEIYGSKDFGNEVPRINEWGFDDKELVTFALAHQAQPISQPFVDVLQTITMHDPYRFLGEERYASRFEERLNQLGLSEAQKGRYRSQRAIYASILYTDDALRRYFDAAKAQPWFSHTIFIITGDHRLPEIPVGEWIDRYHVPLIIHSALLKGPQRFKAVSSQFDIAPTLLAFLAHDYGLRSPASVTWLGSGLDLESGFRNTHEMPLKQTKPALDTFVQGQWALNRDSLYRLLDGLHAEPVQDEKMLARLQGRFSALRAANAAFQRSGALMPAGASQQWIAYDASQRHGTASGPQQDGPGLAIGDVQAPAHAREGSLAIDLVLTNSNPVDSALTVPLAVLQTADGLELSESYGTALRVAGHGDARQHLAIKTDGVPPGQYYLSVFPSDPDKGSRMGDGRFHVPVVIDR